MRTHKTQGIVLHTVKYGDSSMIAYILTRHAGRQNYMVQGVRSTKSRSNKAALFQPMFLVEFESIETPHSQMHRIKDLRSSVVLRSLAFDVRKSTISLFMAETIYRLIRETEQNEPLFDFVFHSVSALDALESGVSNFHLWFLVKLSYFLGFYPANEYVQDGYFNIQDGCFCRNIPDHRQCFSQQESHILHQMMGIEISQLGDIELKGQSRSNFLSSLLLYFSYHFESVHNIRSVEILREVF